MVFSIMLDIYYYNNEIKPNKMSLPTQKKENKKADEISQFLLTANQDLIKAENDEQYEQCALISTAINLYMTNEAYDLSEKDERYTQPQLFKFFKIESDYIYRELKKNN